jgi:hypothetical protein
MNGEEPRKILVKRSGFLVEIWNLTLESKKTGPSNVNK